MMPTRKHGHASLCGPGISRSHGTWSASYLQRCQAEPQADHEAEEKDHDDAVPRDRGPAAVVAAAAVVSPRGRHAAGSRPEAVLTGSEHRPIQKAH